MQLVFSLDMFSLACSLHLSDFSVLCSPSSHPVFSFHIPAEGEQPCPDLCAPPCHPERRVLGLDLREASAGQHEAVVGGLGCYCILLCVKCIFLPTFLREK